jgi:zinc and cadmium transporter
MFNVLISSVIIMFASLIGVISVWKQIGKIIEKNLHFLVSFSAGVFLFISYKLIHETLEHATSTHTGIVWVLVGIFAIWFIFKLLPTFHHHHDNDTDIHVHSHLDARKIILSDAIHNIGDGILLVTSFAVSSALGWIATLSIFVHEIIQEISEFFVLKGAGYTTKKALRINFFTSATILIGSLGGFFLLKSFEIFEIPLLGIASGSFLMVVIQDLIPNYIKTSTTNTHIIKHIIWFIIGLLLMIGISSITPH